MIPADELADVRAAFDETKADQAEILRPTRAASSTQPGRHTSTPTVVATYACTVQAAPVQQYRGVNQITSEADWIIRLPALADVRNTDTIRVTFAETGETKSYSIVEIGKRSGELQRIVYAKGVGASA